MKNEKPKKNPVNLPFLPIIQKLFLLQCLIALLLSLLIGLRWGTLEAISGLIGGMICIVPGLIFMLIFFKQTGALYAKKIVQAFYWGETLKLLISLALFTVAFQWSKLKPLPMLIVFIATQLAYWLILWFGSEKGK